MNAIPQAHDGILYRSRTEARWSEFFALADIPFEYEAEGYDLNGEWYVPDFKLYGAIFEVKGVAPNERECRVAANLASLLRVPVVVAVGNPGSCTLMAFEPGQKPQRCSLVAEFKSETGGWIAEFADGGGWSLPLKPGLVNCSATGENHPLLAVAGRLQFQPPPVPAESKTVLLSRAVQGVLDTLQSKRARWQS